MPHLDSPLHIEMFNNYKRKNKFKLLGRVLRAIKSKEIYGMEWGDPEAIPPLQYFIKKFIEPYVNPESLALEIGPGGGRWIKYFSKFKKVYAVDYHQEILDELKKNFKNKNVIFIKNSGTDFPSIESESIDYVFSFGVFVHLNIDIIEGYLNNIHRIIKPGSNVVIQYSDKTKIMAKENLAFSDNTPETMRGLVSKAGYIILEEDTTSLWHSSIIRFTK